MNREEFLAMDPYITFSWVNMKLRDEFDSLDALAENYDIAVEDIARKLDSVGYKYNEAKNQFISIEAQ